MNIISKTARLAATLAFTFLNRYSVLAQPAILDSAVDPANGHIYFLLGASDWTNAEIASVSLGGHLATIRNLNENNWIWNRWGTNNLWIGLHDPVFGDGSGAQHAADFLWSSGEINTYRNWNSGEPNNTAGLEYFAAIIGNNSGSAGFWNDAPDASTGTLYGVAEVIVTNQLAILDSAVNPANGHTYYLLGNSDWSDAEAAAVTIGGHLATIRNAAESQWIYDRWGTNRDLWIGLYDPIMGDGTGAQHAADFLWSSGATNIFRNWRPGEPNNGNNGEYYAYIAAKGLSYGGEWNDYPDVTQQTGEPPLYGVVEVLAATNPFLTNGLVAYYPFNGHANDASGNGNNASFVGTNYLFSSNPSCTITNGTFIDAGNIFPPTQGAFTESCWVKSVEQQQPGGNGYLKHIVFMTRRTGTNSNYSGDGGWATLDINAYGYLDLTVDDDGYGDGCYNTNYTASSVLDGTWHHLVGVKNNSLYSLYFDGQPIAAVTDAHVLSASDGARDFWIGRHIWNYAAPLESGDLDASLRNVRIYNLALSTNEVAQLYAYESGSATIPPAITSQPTSQTVNQGSPVNFTVIASGPGLNYQWQFNATNILGATNANYNIPSATTNNSGNYDVVVSGPGGSVTSSNTVLIVIPPPRTATATAVLTGSFVTGITNFDGGNGYTTPPLIRFIGGGGSGALGFTVISNGTLISITVTNAGYGYTNPPLVVVEPPFISNPFLGIEPYSFLDFSNLTIGGTYQLQQFNVWYWTNQPVNLIASNSMYTQMIAGVNGNYRLALNPVPTQAFATGQLYNDFVVGAIVTSGGSGYVTAPAINVVGGGGTGAEGYARISGGVVTGITFTNAGYGYTNIPTIQIAPPPAAAVAATVFPAMRVDSAGLAPYDNYQVQFKPLIDGTWANWNGGLFTPTAATNSQFIFITNGAGFFRVQYAP